MRLLLFKRKIVKYFPHVKFLLIFLSFSFLLFLFVRFFFPFYKFAQENNLTPSFFKSLIFGGDSSLKKYQGRTNLIILGIPGGNHEGASLTDTIIFLSFGFNRKDVLMVSLPRDIYVPSLKAKINTAFRQGEEKQKNGGFILSKAIVEEVIGQPVHYAVIIDFEGFKKIIDYIGGIDIFVEREFTDDFYPIPGRENDLCNGDFSFACRYEKVKFEKGWQHFDGETALKYVRSRQGTNDEGTDFARSRRQQQVILAVKEKIFNFSFLRNPRQIFTLARILNQTVITDLNWSEKIFLAKYLTNLRQENIRRLTLDTGDEKQKKQGLLVNPPLWEYNGAWVLVPRSGNFKEIHQYIACYLEDSNCSQ